MNHKLVNLLYSFSLLPVIAFLSFFLINSIIEEIEKSDHIQNHKNMIVDKLKFIRMVQQIFKDQRGYYSSNWNNLIEFSKGSIYVISKDEIVMIDPLTKMDIVTYIIDTISIVSVYDSVYSKSIYRPEILKMVPGYDQEVAFILETDSLELHGLNLQVIRVYNPQNIENVNLGFGSLKKPTLNGNWD